MKGDIPVEKCLLEKHVDERLGKSRALLLSLCKRWHRGVCTEEMARDELCTDACEVLGDILQPFGLSRTIDENTVQLFLDEYRLWQDNALSENTGDTEWLFYFSRSDTSPTRVSAPLYAKEQFFRVVSELELPVETFLPLPAGIPDPKSFCEHTYATGGDYVIRFECAGNEDFFKDPDPTGKEYILINEYGLKMPLLVEHIYKNGELVPYRNHFLPKKGGVMAVNGSIEGYTAGRKRPFEIEKSGNSTVRVYIRLDMEDQNVHGCFPLWNAYHSCIFEKNRLMADARFRCFTREYEAFRNAENTKKHT